MSNEEWFVASWDDPRLLEGTGVAKALRRIGGVLPGVRIVVSGFEGKGRDIGKLPTEEDSLRSFSQGELETVLTDVLQVEWCDFLFPKESVTDDALSDGSYRELLDHLSCMVRAVDGHVLMVYSQDESVVRAFSSEAKGVEVTRSSLDDLTFPS